MSVNLGTNLRLPTLDLVDDDYAKIQIRIGQHMISTVEISDLSRHHLTIVHRLADEIPHLRDVAYLRLSAIGLNSEDFNAFDVIQFFPNVHKDVATVEGHTTDEVRELESLVLNCIRRSTRRKHVSISKVLFPASFDVQVLEAVSESSSDVSLTIDHPGGAILEGHPHDTEQLANETRHELHNGVTVTVREDSLSVDNYSKITQKVSTAARLG